MFRAFQFFPVSAICNRLRIWGSGVQVPPGAPIISIAFAEFGFALPNSSKHIVITIANAPLPPETSRIDILLTHLHMDHIQGLGFFSPLYNPQIDLHIWGPASGTLSLAARLSRYEVRQLRGRLRAFARRSPPITGSLESSLET